MSNKKNKELEIDIQAAFDHVKHDISFLFDRIQANEAVVKETAVTTLRNSRLLKKIAREFKYSHKHGKVTGKIYPTLSGKVKALAEHLGVEFEVAEAQKIPAKVSVSKKTVKKATKK